MLALNFNHGVYFNVYGKHPLVVQFFVMTTALKTIFFIALIALN